MNKVWTKGEPYCLQTVHMETQNLIFVIFILPRIQNNLSYGFQRHDKVSHTI